MKENENNLEKAIKAVKNGQIPPGPTQELADAALEKLKQASKQSDNMRFDEQVELSKRFKVIHSLVRIAALIVLLITVGYIGGRLSAPEPDMEQIQAELELAIREKLLERVREELPYVCAVLIKKFDESRRANKKLVIIEADILVEKRSQQGIILGAGASQLRDLGISARKDLEQLLGCKVYLGLRVTTARNWRNNESILDELELGT